MPRPDPIELYTVTIAPDDLPGFLDMLRYDFATVESFVTLPAADTGAGRRGVRYAVTLRARRAERARWASFGIPVIEGGYVR